MAAFKNNRYASEDLLLRPKTEIKVRSEKTKP